MKRDRSLGLTLVAALALAASGGCQQYWTKAGGTQEMFWRDSGECARAASPSPTAAAHGIVNDQQYRACLSARGWLRQQHPEPAPPGWFRGVD